MSSTLKYLYDGVVDTYDETVDYWSKDGSLSDAVDTVVWSAQNTDTVAAATKKGVEKSINKLNIALIQDRNKLILLLGLGAAAYFYYKKGGRKTKWNKN